MLSAYFRCVLVSHAESCLLFLFQMIQSNIDIESEYAYICEHLTSTESNSELSEWDDTQISRISVKSTSNVIIILQL